MLEVMGFRTLLGLGFATIKVSPPLKIAQASHVEIALDGPIDQTFGIDGEVSSIRTKGKFLISFASQINYLRYDGR